MNAYSGKEPSLSMHTSGTIEPDTVFEVRPVNLPHRAVPIFDDSVSAVVGYQHTLAGISQYFNLAGSMVGFDEPGLETPLLDPIDAIFFAGGVFRALGKGFFLNGATRTTPKMAGRAAAAFTTKGLTTSVVGLMRATLKGLSIRTLRFLPQLRQHTWAPEGATSPCISCIWRSSTASAYLIHKA